MKVISILLVLSGALGGCFGKKEDPMKEVLGKINGREVTLGDIQVIAASELEMHRQKLYNIKREAFEEFARRQVIEKAARAEGSTLEEYFAFFHEAQPAEITAAEKERFQKKLGTLISQLPAAQQKEIEKEIKEDRLARAKSRLVSELVRRNNVVFTLPQPGAETSSSHDAQRRNR